MGPEQGKSATGRLGWSERGVGRAWGAHVGRSKNRSQKTYQWPGLARPDPPSPPPGLRVITLSMFLDFLPHCLCPGHTLCPDGPSPGKCHSSSSVPPRSTPALRAPRSLLVRVNPAPRSYMEALITEKFLLPRTDPNLQSVIIRGLPCGTSVSGMRVGATSTFSPLSAAPGLRPDTE